MAFDGTEGEQISQSEAQTMMQNYQSSNPNCAEGHFIGKDLIEDILSQTGCIGITCYYGEDSTGTKKLIMVGTQSNEQDMFSGIVADRANPRP